MTREEIERLDGEALAAAVAEQVMEWSDDGGWWAPPDIVPGAAIEIWRWRPDQDIVMAFEVMRAKPEWRWTIGEWANGRTWAHVGDLDSADVEGITVSVLVQHGTDWARAWCVAICRCALMAVQE